MRSKIIAVGMLVLLVFMAVLVWTPPVQAQSPTIDYAIRMEKAEVTIDVRPGQPGTAQNRVLVDNQSIHSLTIQIQSNCGGGISVSPISATVGAPAGGSTELPLAISALPKTALQQKDCSVNAMVTHVDGISSPDQAQRNTGFKALVLQFAQVSVEANQPFIKIGPGKRIDMVFKIRNTGNYVDDYKIELPNAKGLEDDGFSITLATPVLLGVNSDDYANLKISIQTPRGTVLGWADEYFSLEVKAASIIEGERSDAKSASTTFWVRGVFIPGFDPLFTIMALGLVSVALTKRKKQAS